MLGEKKREYIVKNRNDASNRELLNMKNDSSNKKLTQEGWQISSIRKRDEKA